MSDRSPRERSEASALKEAGSAIKREGREIAGEAKSAAYSVAREQRDAVAGFVSALVGAASRGADELEESGFARSAAAVRRTAGEVSGLAERLQQRDPRELWSDIEGFAREHPAVVFGAGFALAFGVARFLRSGSPEDGEHEMAGSYEGSSSYGSAAAAGVGESRGESFAPTPQSDPATGATPPAAGN
jgi:hypothetical protein